MTNRERLSKTFNHELPDRVPALVYARAEVERDLLAYYGVRRFKEVLQNRSKTSLPGMRQSGTIGRSTMVFRPNFSTDRASSN
jgi:hypothetical protein